MPLAHISLGSNLGDREAILGDAVAALSKADGVVVRAVSSYHETRPVGGPGGQGLFLNAAASLETTREPEDLLRLLQSIEQAAGRVRTVRWGERPLDLDLLLYEDRTVRTTDLILPHPRMALRRFVLSPLAEIAPGAVDPVTGRTVFSLLANLDRRPSYVAIAGFPRPTYILEGESTGPWCADLERQIIGPQPGLKTVDAIALRACGGARVRPHPEFARRSLRDRICEALPALALQFPRTITRPRCQSEFEKVARSIFAMESHRILEDEGLLALLNPKASGARAPENEWIVSDFWYDFGALDLYDWWTGTEPQLTDHARYLKLRATILPPTFVVMTEDDRHRSDFEDEGPLNQAATQWPGVAGTDTPTLVVESYESDATFREVMAACEATRAG